MKPLLILIGAGIAALGLIPDAKKDVDGDAKSVPNTKDGENPQNEPAPLIDDLSALDKLNNEGEQP
jgi:hypothetical protein